MKTRDVQQAYKVILVEVLVTVDPFLIKEKRTSDLLHFYPSAFLMSRCFRRYHYYYFVQVKVLVNAKDLNHKSVGIQLFDR